MCSCQNTPEIVRAEAVAKMLDLKKATVYALAKRGELPSIKVGRSVRFDLAVIRQWIADQHAEAAS